MASLTVSARAKVNLYLAVGPLRGDGYHDVTTVMQSISLADEIVLAPAEELALACDPDPCESVSRNLAFRAAVALAESAGRAPDVSIAVGKHIPTGAGLGGGSADAAGVLVGLCELWSLDPHAEEVRRIAASLGADVPFMLTGGAALLDDRGDRLVRRLPAPRLDVVLVNPGVPVSTAEAYAAFDRLPAASRPDPDALAAALGSAEPRAVAAALFNNMTPASAGLVPGISDALAFLDDSEGVLGSIMAGSGSTVFGICSDAAVAVTVAEEARSRGWWAEATVTAEEGVRVVRREQGA